MRCVLPYMVTTRKALRACVKAKAELIWLPYEFYKEDTMRIFRLLKKNGYRIAIFPARNGIFFARGLDEQECFIEDPYHVY